MTDINKYISNTVSWDQSRYKAAIIGSNLGARSPILGTNFRKDRCRPYNAPFRR